MLRSSKRQIQGDPGGDRLLGQEGHDALYGEGATLRSSTKICARLVPEANDAPGSEVHHRVYKMVGMKALLGA